MSTLTFTKATKAKAKARVAVFGPSGAGKTYSSLRIAKGMIEHAGGGKIAVIDTERGSASKYADRFEFDVLDLPTKNIDTYVAAIRAAGQAGYTVLIIDSLSHAWQELLQEVEKLAKARYRGNTWSAWSEGTPKQRQLVDAILDFPGHVFATMRSKTEWSTEQTGNGKSKPVRVGLAPEQGKGIEYEFDVLLEVNVDHIGNILKDRSGKFQDKLIDQPGEEFGTELAQWLSDGAEVAKPAPQQQQDTSQPTPEPQRKHTELRNADFEPNTPPDVPSPVVTTIHKTIDQDIEIKGKTEAVLWLRTEHGDFAVIRRADAVLGVYQALDEQAPVSIAFEEGQRGRKVTAISINR